MGATVLGRLMGTRPQTAPLALRTLTLAGYSALLAGGVTVYVDAILGALTGHTWEVFGALWLYAMAVGGAVTGVSGGIRIRGVDRLTLFLVVVGNAAAAGPVGGRCCRASIPPSPGSCRRDPVSRCCAASATSVVTVPDAAGDTGDLGGGGVSPRNPRHRFAGELSCHL